MRKFIQTFGLILCGLTQTLLAQNLPYQHYTERNENLADTNNLQHFFRNGNFYGHARSYFSLTNNADQLSDYFAHAFGMGIGYETGKFKNFQMGISGFFVYKLYASNLNNKDALTGQGSRYELGLFDMENPGNQSDLNRLEDLYLKYNYKKSNIKFGKQHIRTPFINPQDARMRPTLVDGIVVSYNEIKNTKIDLGYLYKISPRSTFRWFNIGESIGLYASGVNPYGNKSNYAGNLQSKGVFYAGFTHQFKNKHELQIWNILVENIFNSSLIQYQHQFNLNKATKLKTGFQATRQQANNFGGHENQNNTYMLKEHKSYTLGGRLEIENKNIGSFQVNYNRITKHGRYLMPREWGRDPFFTFMPRERNEGYADLHAITAVYGKKFGKSGFKSDISYGRFYLPAISNTEMNKYAFPSYWQFNADIRYQAHGFLKGIDFQLMYVYKGQMGSNYKNNSFVFNKVDMSLYNFVINYHF